MGKKSNAWKILVRKPEGKRPCERCLIGCEDENWVQ
jgi:hypothetical protein